jgi:hypothetical protein
MTEKTFDRPIAVSRDTGSTLKIASVQQAADLLMSADWPGERDAWHRDAVDACLKVIEGNRSTEDAEKAFRQAATKAGILAES